MLVQNSMSPTDRLTGVECRATSLAKTVILKVFLADTHPPKTTPLPFLNFFSQCSQLSKICIAGCASTTTT